MTFDEFMNGTTMLNITVTEIIKARSGDNFPSISLFLRTAYDVGYEQGHKDMAEEFPGWDLRE